MVKGLRCIQEGKVDVMAIQTMNHRSIAAGPTALAIGSTPLAGITPSEGVGGSLL